MDGWMDAKMDACMDGGMDGLDRVRQHGRQIDG